MAKVMRIATISTGFAMIMVMTNKIAIKGKTDITSPGFAMKIAITRNIAITKSRGSAIIRPKITVPVTKAIQTMRISL